MKKGFTLVELLAVIVILAIIALIATPIIINIINDAKEASALRSAEGYMRAVENTVALSNLKESRITDGIYNVKDENIKAEYSGNGPTIGSITITNGIVTSAKLCIDNVSIDYEENENKLSSNNYCLKNELIVDGEKIENEQNLSPLTIDKKDGTNIICNNGVTITEVENNEIKIDNIVGKVECKFSNSVVDSVTNMDDTKNYILMLNDDSITETLTLTENKNLVFDLNGKTITYNGSDYAINNYGNLFVKELENKNGKIISSSVAIHVQPNAISKVENIDVISNDMGNASAICTNGYLVISGDTYIKGPFGIGCHNNDNAVTIINDAYIESTEFQALQINEGYKASVTINNGYFEGYRFAIAHYGTGIININGGKYISNSNTIANFSTGEVKITNEKDLVYISSSATTWLPAVLNNSTGTINVIGKRANNCTSDPNEITTGICIYAANSGNVGIQNVAGSVNINGATIYGSNNAINNSSTNLLNINNSEIKAKSYGIWNNSTGTVNVCSSTIDANSYVFGQQTNVIGTINYSNDVLFTNSKVFSNPNGIINSGYTGSCLAN